MLKDATLFDNEKRKSKFHLFLKSKIRVITDISKHKALIIKSITRPIFNCLLAYNYKYARQSSAYFLGIEVVQNKKENLHLPKLCIQLHDILVRLITMLKLINPRKSSLRGQVVE